MDSRTHCDGVMIESAEGINVDNYGELERTASIPFGGEGSSLTRPNSALWCSIASSILLWPQVTFWTAHSFKTKFSFAIYLLRTTLRWPFKRGRRLAPLFNIDLTCRSKRVATQGRHRGPRGLFPGSCTQKHYITSCRVFPRPVIAATIRAYYVLVTESISLYVLGTSSLPGR